MNLTPFTHEVACDILGGADSDADGFLSWEEFQLAVEQTCIEAVRQSILAEPEDEQGPQENLQRPEPEFLDPEEEVEVVVENPQVEVSLLDGEEDFIAVMCDVCVISHLLCHGATPPSVLVLFSLSWQRC